MTFTDICSHVGFETLIADTNITPISMKYDCNDCLKSNASAPAHHDCWCDTCHDAATCALKIQGYQVLPSRANLQELCPEFSVVSCSPEHHHAWTAEAESEHSQGLPDQAMSSLGTLGAPQGLQQHPPGRSGASGG